VIHDSSSGGPLSPTPAGGRSYVKQWQIVEKYRFQYQALSLLFQRLCPANDELGHVLLKVRALNDFYSTNIFDTHSVAKQFVRKLALSRADSRAVAARSSSSMRACAAACKRRTRG
jgi:hypothetical protein